MKFLYAILYQMKIISMPWWIVIGVTTALLVIFRHRTEQLPGNLLIIYILAILATTVLARNKINGFEYSDLINMELIKTWEDRLAGNDLDKYELILNFFMLMPIGILFPWASKKGLFATVSFGFVLITVIETAQLLSKRGWFELCDIVDNIIGLVIGYGLFVIGRSLWIKCRR